MTFIQLLVSGLLLGGVYGLMSVGLTLIFGVARIINFAHGEFLMLAMYGSFWLWQYTGLDPYISILIVVPLVGLLGYLTEWTIIRRVIGKPSVVQIFSTLGLSVFFQNLALLIWKGDFRSITTAYSSLTWHVAGIAINAPRLVAFIIAGVAAFGLFQFLNHTFLGKAIRATAQNREVARLMGVNIRQIYVIVFVLGTALAGLAGVLLTPVFPAYPTVGVDLIMVAFVAVVLGGLGDVYGALLGGLVLGVVETMSGFYVAPDLKQAIYFIIFIVILIIRPSGLFGIRGAEEVGFD